MTARKILESASESVTLFPALSPKEIAELQVRLRVPLPGEISDLLAYSGGLDLAPGRKIRFDGFSGFVFADALPRSIALAHDEFGNFWAVDVDELSGNFGAVFFICHDPPVIVLYADDLNGFLLQMLASKGLESEHSRGSFMDIAIRRIWKHDPWLKPILEAQAESDPILSNFAERQPANFLVADLRARQIGSGFSWGRAGPNAKTVRAGQELIFAVELAVPK